MSARSHSVLIVDDDRAQRTKTAQFFADRGFEVREAVDGEDALARMRERAPEAVLSDVLMPRLDGFRFCMAVRADRQLSRVPVVLTTSRYLEPEDEELGRRSGAAAFLPRTDDFRPLVEAVLEAIRRSPPAPPAPADLRSLEPQYQQRLVRQVELLAADSAGQAEALGRAAAQLESAERRWRTLMENAHDAITTLSPDGTILEVNQTGVELFGRPRDQLIGHRFTEWYPAEVGAQHLAAFQKSCAGSGPSEAYEVKIARPDGSGVWMEFHNRLVQLDGEQVVISIGRDVTGRSRAAHELQLLHAVALATSEADDLLSVLRILLSCVSESGGWKFSIAWLPDSAGGIEPRCFWLRGEVDTERFRKEVPPRRERGQGLVGSVWESGLPDWCTDIANEPRMTDGKDALVRFGLRSSLTFPVTLKGEVVAVLQCFASESRTEDATVLKLMSAVAAQVASVIRRKRTEEALRRSEEELRQVQKMEAIGQLTGGIAHDFNNLLGVIIANAEMLTEQLAPDDSRRDDVAQIKKAGDRAATLTRQLLAFSRKQVLAPRVIPLAEVVAGMEAMLRRVIGEHIVFTTSLAKDTGRVFADPGQLEQVLINLAVNARDAMPRGGSLRIETGNLEMDAACAALHAPAKPGKYVTVSVSDDGCGMDAETRRRAFEPFFTTKEHGTGLGLSTCYGIVKQSDGFIWLYSEPGRGTTFKIYLPRADRPVDAAPAPEPACAPGGGETVLVVEDEESLRRVVERVLTARGYSVLVARDGAEGLAVCNGGAGGCIDLIVTDVITPTLTGPEMAQRLREAGNHIPILFMSGYVHDMLPAGELRRPGVKFIQKPFAGEALARKVREVLDAAAGERESA